MLGLIVGIMAVVLLSTSYREEEPLADLDRYGFLPVTSASKAEFFRVIQSLPTQGEFFSDAGVRRAKPYLAVLLTLNQKDLRNYDVYPFAALGVGLADDGECRDFVLKNFDRIVHPELKLIWALRLFDSGATSPALLEYLYSVTGNEKRLQEIAPILGPDYREVAAQIRRAYLDRSKLKR